jgi:SAM-dependent methyltransferase
VGEDPAASIRNIASTLIRHVQPGAKVLDFGAGPMDKTGGLQLLGYRCSAVDDLNDFWHLESDNRSRIMEFARKIGIDFHLGALPEFPSESFDVVMICDVLEHFYDSPRALLGELLRLIKPEGYLFVLVPHAANIRKRIDLLRGKSNLPDFRIYYWADPFRGHVREYVKDDLIQLNDFLGLQMVELKTCHNMITKVPPGLRPIYKGLTSVFPGWRDTLILMSKKPAGWQLPPPMPRDEYYRIAGNPYVRKALDAAVL